MDTADSLASGIQGHKRGSFVKDKTRHIFALTPADTFQADLRKPSGN